MSAETALKMTPDVLAEALGKLDVGELRVREPMREHTTMKVGGPADVFVVPSSREALKRAVRFAREHKVPWLALGNGSNLLVRDGGLEGIVFSLKGLDQLDILDADLGRVRADAGVPMARLIRVGLENSFEGVWHLGGIPGTVGGAVRMNAGTRYGELESVLESVEVMSAAGMVKTYARTDLEFGYRSCSLPKDKLILGATLLLGKGEGESLRTKHREVMSYRSNTQPLTFPSVGSVFRNPPPNKNGEVMAAGKLLELSNLKGVRIRGAQISEKHANWIVNVGNARCADVLALVRLMKDKVKQEHGVVLELEAKVVGREDPSDEA